MSKQSVMIFFLTALTSGCVGLHKHSSKQDRYPSNNSSKIQCSLLPVLPDGETPFVSNVEFFEEKLNAFNRTRQHKGVYIPMTDASGVMGGLILSYVKNNKIKLEYGFDGDVDNNDTSRTLYFNGLPIKHKLLIASSAHSKQGRAHQSDELVISCDFVEVE